MAVTQIRGAQILDLTITAADIASDAVTKPKILNDAVDETKLDLSRTYDFATESGTVRVQTPVAGTDAANKTYVDNSIYGLDWHSSVRVATTTAGTLASSFENGDTVDGVVLATGNRILIKNQASGIENGIYTVNASGSPTRASDMATSSAAASAAVFVEEGTTNADSGWVCTNDAGSDVVGTNSLVFVQFTGLGQITAGSGLSKTGNTLDVNVDDSTIEISADTLRVKASGITGTQLATSVAGDGLAGGGGSALSVNVDGVTIEINADTLRVKDLGISTAKIANGAVTVAKLSDLQVTAGTGALAVDVAAGTIRDDNVITSVSATDELAVADATTNYVEVNSAGTVSTNTTGFTASRIPLATVVTAGGVITSINDKRSWLLIDQTSVTSTSFVVREVPSGSINGSNVTFTLAFTPISGKEHVYLNGLLQNLGAGNDYTISGATITYNTAPATGDVLLVSYLK